MNTSSSQSFLATLREKYEAKERDRKILVDYLKALEREMTKDAALIRQIEEFIETDASPLARLPEQVSALLSTYRKNVADSSTGPSASQNDGGHGSAGTTDSDHIRETAADIVRRAGRVLSSTEILEGIQDAGYVFSSKNPSELIKKVIKRAPNIERHGRGYWLVGVELPTVSGKGRPNKRKQA